MNKALKLIVLGLALAAASAYGQTSLTQTTTAAAQNGYGLQGGGSTSYDTILSLTSATGVTQAFNGQPVTYVFVGGEMEGILTTVPGSTTIFNVLRGQLGTKISDHPSGDMALLGVVTPQFGGSSGSAGFQDDDPPLNAGCTSTSTNQTPWVNFLTGYQWLCSSVTNTWVPGWNNPFAATSPKLTAAVASAAGVIVPSGPLFQVSGTNAITGFTIPVGFNATAVGGGCFTVIPRGVFSYTAAGNIGLASSGLNAGTAVVVVNQPITFCWDANQLKFLPNTQ